MQHIRWRHASGAEAAVAEGAHRAPALRRRCSRCAAPAASATHRRRRTTSIQAADTPPTSPGGAYGSGGSGSGGGPAAAPPLSFDEAAATVLQGRSFHCTMCGKCCTMEDDGEVWVSRREVRGMAAFLEITEAAFVAQHCLDSGADGLTIPGWRLLRSQRAADGPLHCTFLDPATNMCRVHAARPVQCSTYPWWPELLAEGDAWEWEKEHICEGLDHADAAPLDVAGAKEQLRRAVAHERAKRRAREAAAAAAAAAAESDLSEGSGSS
ncbi:MAG: hypothetical protein J3K34DRAFT_459116 [Monoraphidium minutum]|nr:MAG: hypothetical protein J3K34DRAFT_459116 [Monoraphidium minutum]